MGALIVAAVAFGAVSTDQQIYSPGSTVTISGDNSNGAGYQTGDAVHVDVAGPSSYAATCDAVVDAASTWSCQVTLPTDPSLAAGGYSYTATDTTAGFSETGAFADDTIIYSALHNMTVGQTETITGTEQGGACNAPYVFTWSASTGVSLANQVDSTDSSSIDVTYNEAGGQWVNLTAVGSTKATPGHPSGPCTVALHKDFHVNVVGGAIVDAGGPYSGNEGSDIALSGASVTGGGANPVYSWSVDTSGSLAGDTAGDTGISCTFSPSNAVLNPTVNCNDDSKGGLFTLTLTYSDDTNTTPITSTAQLTVNNVAPTVASLTGDTSVNESSTTTHHYTYTISDPGSNDSQTPTISCGSADGAAVSNATNTATGGGFDCTFPDGEVPANTSTVSVYSTDDNGGVSNTAPLDVTVNNVNPTVAAFTPATSICSVSVPSISFTDPGQAYDNNYTGSIDWGDSNSTSLGTTQYSTPSFTGPFTHTYSVGGSYVITASVTDGDTGVGTNTATINNTFGVVGWPVPPIMTGKTFKVGSTIPVKIQTSGCPGGESATISLDPAAGTPKSSGNSNDGISLRFTAALPGYIYNFSTKSNWPIGFYTVTVTFSGPFSGSYSAPIQLVK